MHHSGVAGPQGRENHHDLYPCAQPRPSRGAQPCRSCVAARTCGSRTRKPRVLLGLPYLKPYAGTGFSRRARAPWAWFAEIPEGSGCASRNLPIKSSKDQRAQAEKEPSLRFLLRTSHAKDAGSIIMENLSSKSIAIQCYECQ